MTFFNKMTTLNFTLRVFIISILIFNATISFSQGIVKGKIFDENSELLIGVTVISETNPDLNAVSDIDGNYSIEIPNNEKYVFIFSYFGLEDQKIEVQVSNNETLEKDVKMSAATFEIKEVVVTAKQEKSKSVYMESLKKKSVATLDYIPAELMKKIGDSNVTAAISRATGVSTNGGFVTVRGIGDRYVRTGINGSLIPTLDPLTNNIQLDLIPASLVDNIIITKTSSPELPADWSAAYISIETKDFPDKLTFNFDSQIGFNSQTSFKKILANKTSPTDWMGFDNGQRDIDHSKYNIVKADPTKYEELVALGLGDYYKSIGVDGWSEGSASGNTYFKLGLIELGLLGKSEIDNNTAVSQAIKKYQEGNYQDKAYSILNSKTNETSKLFSNNWATKFKRAPLNYSNSFSFGNQHELGEMKIGYLLGLRYGSSIDYDPFSTNIRSIVTEYDSLKKPLIQTYMDQKFARYTNNWSSLANLNIKVNGNNSFSFLFMPNFSGNNSIREGIDKTLSSTYNYAYTTSQYYEERRQLIYQMKAENYLPSLKLKSLFNLSYTKGRSSIPDFKDLDYFGDVPEESRFDLTLSNVRRNFRYLNDDVFDTRLVLELPIKEVPNKINKVKFGVAYSNSIKDFLQYDYRLFFNKAERLFETSKLENFFSEDKFKIKEIENQKDNIDLFYIKNNDASNNTVGSVNIGSAFGSYDYTLTDKIRLAGGVRGEYAQINSDVEKFKMLKLPANDFRRRPLGSTLLFNPVSKSKFNFLPSFNLIYKIVNDEINPTNLRLNYSRSVARPSVREYTETIMYDFELRADVFGNTDLKFVDINNYDLRFEKYFSKGNNLFLSLFYKNFKNHIEITTSSVGFSWTNAESSYVYGFEFEATKSILSNLEFKTNVSLVNSSTTFYNQRLEINNNVRTWIKLDKVSRSMLGQAPFVVNALLNYNLDSLGLSASLSYNVQGPKLVFNTTGNEPDVFEMPRHLLDFKISKSLGEKFNLSFSVRDIFNSPRRRAYKYPDGYRLDFDKFTFGTNYNIGISYKI